jgi:hypothetical protein
MSLRSGVYIVPTKSWYIERTVWLVAGMVLLSSTALALWVDTRWVLLVIATGVASFVGGVMVWFAATGFCIMANGLYWLGAEPRLVPLRQPAPPAKGGRGSIAAT